MIDRSELPLSVDDLKLTVESIASMQKPSGWIPWGEREHGDPWNHVESAMALTLGGLKREAERAYAWLADRQRADGAWESYFHHDGTAVKDPNVDTNICAYVAVGVWQHYLETTDRRFLEDLWPVVDRAIDFVVGLQAPTGAIWWAQNEHGERWDEALLTGSSSIHLSLRCAVEIASHLGHDRPHWRRAHTALGQALRERPDAFGDRDRWAMDWYYPILGGAWRGAPAVRRLGEKWELFLVEGRGIRCVHDRPWVTAAETCELVLTLCAIGQHRQALPLFEWVQFLRTDEGDYWEGWVWPDDVFWPERRSTWTSAAVVLAADALVGTSPTARLFGGAMSNAGKESAGLRRG